MPGPDEMTTLRVAARVDEAEDVVSLRLEDPAGADLPAWTPGAHVDVEAPPGLLRQYSLCGDPADRRGWRIAVLREDPGRGGSRHLHDAVPVGSTLRTSLPRNISPLLASPRYVFLAGGIGITPILPMVRAAEAAGAEWQLWYGGRRRSRMAFLEELACYGDRVRVRPEDEHGLLPLAQILADAPEDAVVQVCGPEPLLAAVEQAGAGRPAGTIRVERFRPRPAQPGLPAARAFEVVAALTGRRVVVDAGQSVLDALDRAGVAVPSSCREGTCASCETTVVEGEVEHRDSVLSDAERADGGTMMICVSRARSDRLVLEI